MNFFLILNKIFSRFERKFYKRKVNWFATYYVNFRTLPFKVAKRLPIYVYGKFKCLSLDGSVSFDGVTPYRGMIKIGRHKDNYILSDSIFMHIAMGGGIVFRGKCSIATGSILRVSSGATLVFGDKVWVGQGVLFDCNCKIDIGDGSSITYNCRLSDSNHHYIIDTERNSINNKNGVIKIGKYNWIGNNTAIVKGTVTPDWTVATHNSLINKNFEKDCNHEHSIVLAGIPAKIIAFNKRRIFNSEIESNLDRLFLLKAIPNIIVPKPINDYVEDKFFE